MGVGTYPWEIVGGLRHDGDEKTERRGLVKVGELTKPMVNVISQEMADCLDPSGNINKELRPVQSIR